MRGCRGVRWAHWRGVLVGARACRGGALYRCGSCGARAAFTRAYRRRDGTAVRASFRHVRGVRAQAFAAGRGADGPRHAVGGPAARGGQLRLGAFFGLREAVLH
jgi:hypothetical protein